MRSIQTLLVLLAFGVLAATWQPRVVHGKRTAATPIAERLFDHARHGKTVRVDCTRCHPANEDGTWAQRGKKEHARCFSCHKYSASCATLQEKEGRVCLACHTKFRSTCIPAAYVRPTLGKKEFSALYSHQQHFRPESNTGSQCENCHGEFGVNAPVSGAQASGHTVCSACHARGVSPKLSKGCVSCHTSISEPSASTAIAVNRYAVRFDHKAHGAREKGQAKRTCVSCHTAAPSATGHSIPSPTMESCRSACHDGAKAFDAVGTNCSRCHSVQSSPSVVQAAGKLHFGHGLHQQKASLNISDCQSCHQQNNGQVQAPLQGKDHQPCNGTACHASEFLSRTPTICIVCHDQVEPWNKHLARIVPAASSEFIYSMSHQKHVSPCADCHGNVLKNEPVPDAHAVCSTCHESEESPAMSACGSCHALGTNLIATKPYSVSARFRHTTHQLDPRSGNAGSGNVREPECSVCHGDVTKAATLNAIATPTMRSCGACHDGGYAFKTTGFGCAKCHGRGS